ncbi:type IV pili twitching motility protein PilT [bacterium]|nr:type IV pili twitching motility protein PilT [bacterium]|tara:strand:- start:330 stop:1403 length:1074 start_codon:yes stop_codon:yes gene_type:complete
MNNNIESELFSLLETVIKNKASDLHLGDDQQPTLRLHGALVPIQGTKKLDSEKAKNLAFSLLNQEQKEKFLKNKEIDLSYNYKNKARFRVNIYFQKGSVSAALRLIPTKIKTTEELNLPPIVKEFAKPSQGFVLITGPAGHGKTTVMASIIDIINRTRNDHIITIEDPIEYIFEQDKCIIDQREVRQDTKTFQTALRSMFRQDANVVMIGEMRDPETISAAVTAAETGHLIFATLHTNTAAQTIDRIIDSFEAHQQSQIRAQLANALLGIISRRLIPTKSGELISAAEVLIVNNAIRNLIRENKIHQIDLVIETSSDMGMVSLNKSLAELVQKNIVDPEIAETYSTNPQELKTLLSQ